MGYQQYFRVCMEHFWAVTSSPNGCWVLWGEIHYSIMGGLILEDVQLKYTDYEWMLKIMHLQYLKIHTTIYKSYFLRSSQLFRISGQWNTSHMRVFWKIGGHSNFLYLKSLEKVPLKNGCSEKLSILPLPLQVVRWMSLFDSLRVVLKITFGGIHLW